MNVSEVTLVYKNVYVPDPGNYRSTLSRFSKLYERFSISLGLGRENSTEKAILQISDTLGNPWKKIELVTCCLLLDFSKEFDRWTMAFCCLHFTIMVFVELLCFCFWEDNVTQFVNIGDTKCSYEVLSLEYHKGQPLVHFYLCVICYHFEFLLMILMFYTSDKALWVVLSSLFFWEIWKN